MKNGTCCFKIVLVIGFGRVFETETAGSYPRAQGKAAVCRPAGLTTEPTSPLPDP